MRFALGCLVAGVAGCGTGSGTSSGTDGDGLAAASALESAVWLRIDLEDGTVIVSEAEPASDGDRHLVVRRIASGTSRLGQPGSDFARQPDEVARAVRTGPFRIAATELTRAQWRRLAGTQPWTADPLSGAWPDRDDLPATGMGFAAATQAVSAWRRGGGRLRLPTPAEWEVAAGGGQTGPFPWGDSRAFSESGRWAVTAESRRDGPQPVGSLLANRFGLHDVCGNVWEYDSSGSIRGGSWADALALARPANSAASDADQGHATIGLRLVYDPD